jgi:hypothetical protein
MTQFPENLQREPLNSSLNIGKNATEVVAMKSVVYVYGHGPTKNPFYEEARTANATAQGASLILSAAVSRGQKLLLINEERQDPVEAEVVRTRTLGAQIFEIEVAFSVPRPDFWRSVHSTVKRKYGRENRRFPRVRLPRGLTVAWQGPKKHDISRISSLSLGGLFIEVADPVAAGEKLRVQFDIPSGAIYGQGVVRRSLKGEGMGVEFTDLTAESRAQLNELLQRLLARIRTS